jgi:putative endopeptidase
MQMFVSKALRILAVAALLSLPFLNADVRAAATATVSGIDTANLDRTCKPCDDFYQFANGGWKTNHPLPAAYPSYGTFTVLALHNRDVLHTILDKASATTSKPGSDDQKIGDFYAACMDEAAIEKAGTAPIQPLLTLASNATAANLPDTLAQMQADGAGGFFGFGANPDAKNSSTNIAYVGQGALGLPNRDYYLNTDPDSAKLRDQYVAHVTTMFGLLGETPDAAATDAKTVLAMETDLAKISLSAADRRDPQKTYHPMDATALAALTPAFDWTTYLKASGVTPAKFNVSSPDYLTGFSTDLATWTPAQLQTYLKWRVVHAYAASLPKAFADANWDFFSHTLQGSKAQLPRWQRCVGATDSALGEALGQTYVAQTFPPKAKAEALAMVQTIKATLRDDLAGLDWMSSATRQKAVKKLDAFMLKIGYPDKWQDYTKYHVTRASYAGNLIASSQYERARDLAEIGKPVDRTEWGMTPPTVNAYYNPSVNEIVFPAGILQPPFYNANADPAVNFGAIGAVIGHESTHGFDNSGRQYDATGNLSDWWTPEDSAKFDVKAKCIIDQFDALEVAPGVHEQGKLVQGEAIADLGGLTIAYKAFEKWQSTHPRQTLDGFTPEQRFFIGFASVWASNDTVQYRTFLAKSNEHPWDELRVNATLSNMPQFAQAWFCKVADKMVRPAADRCQIW